MPQMSRLGETGGIREVRKVPPQVGTVHTAQMNVCALSMAKQKLKKKKKEKDPFSHAEVWSDWNSNKIQCSATILTYF